MSLKVRLSMGSPIRGGGAAASEVVKTRRRTAQEAFTISFHIFSAIFSPLARTILPQRFSERTSSFLEGMPKPCILHPHSCHLYRGGSPCSRCAARFFS